MLWYDARRSIPMLRSSPSLILLVACLLAGCGNDGTWMQTWWGPTDSGEGDSPFPPGGSFQVQGFVHRVQTDAANPRDLVEVVLVGAEQDVTCDAYRRFLDEVAELQAWVDVLLASSTDEWPTSWVPYVCQELRGAASDAFGGGGAYRAVHVLAEVTGGVGPSDDVFRAAVPGSDEEVFGGGELLVPGSMVSRVYERSQHGDGVLPQNSGGDNAPWRRACLSQDGTTECDIDPDRDCAGYLSRLVADWQEERDTYLHFYLGDEAVAGPRLDRAPGGDPPLLPPLQGPGVDPDPGLGSAPGHAAPGLGPGRRGRGERRADSLRGGQSGAEHLPVQADAAQLPGRDGAAHRVHRAGEHGGARLAGGTGTAGRPWTQRG